MGRNADHDTQLPSLERALRDHILRRLSEPSREKDEELALDFDDILENILLLERKRKPRPGIHPSSLGGCRRKMYYEAIGAPRKEPPSPDKRLKMKMSVSSGLHNWIQGKFNATGEHLIIAHEVPVPETTEAFVSYSIRGTCDTLVSLPDTGANILIVDYKFISSAEFKKLSAPKQQHIRQITAYMFSFHCPLAILEYADKDSTRRKPFYVPFDHSVWKDIVEEIRFVQEAKRLERIPPRQTDFFVCKTICKYTQICKPPLKSRNI